MYFLRFRAFLVLVVIFGVFTTTLWSQNISKQQLITEFRAGSNKAREQFSAIQGKAEYIAFGALPNTPQQLDKKFTFDFAFTQLSAKMIMFPEVSLPEPTEPKTKKAKKYDITACFNNDYWFQLSRDNANDEYRLTNLSEEPSKGKDYILNHHGLEVLGPIYPSQRPIDMLLKNDDSDVDSVNTELDQDGSKNYIIKYTNKSLGKLKSDKPITTGWFIVSPDKDWVVSEYGRVFFGPNTTHTEIGKIEYRQNGKRQYEPIKHTKRSYMNQINRGNQNPGNAVGGFDIIYKNIKFEALPESKFRLPAFGLPEVANPTKKGAFDMGAPGFFVCAIIGFTCAGGLKYLSSKMGQKTQRYRESVKDNDA